MSSGLTARSNEAQPFETKPLLQAKGSFAGIVSRHGFSGYIALDIDQVQNDRINPILLDTDISPDVMFKIEALGGLGQSSLFDGFLTSNAPFNWEPKTTNIADGPSVKNTIDRMLTDGIPTFGPHSAYSIPIYSICSKRCAVIYLASRLEQGAQYPELMLDTIELFQSTFQKKSPEQSETISLNKGERKCLLWAANGKTSNEIASILSLSEHTVNHYFSIAMGKLGATNRTQAIAKAIHHRLIDFSDQRD